MLRDGVTDLQRTDIAVRDVAEQLADGPAWQSADPLIPKIGGIRVVLAEKLRIVDHGSRAPLRFVNCGSPFARVIGGGDRLLDDLDKAIIKALQLDGRRPTRRSGGELKVPEATVRQRAERLISRSIVQVVGVTDHLAMGFSSRPSSACTSMSRILARWRMRWPRWTK